MDVLYPAAQALKAAADSGAGLADAFGGLLWGVDVRGGKYAGGVFDWLSPFSVITAAAVVGGYVMFGSTYIIMKTQGPVARFARRTAGWGAGLAAAGALADTILAVGKYPFLSERWGAVPDPSSLSFPSRSG